MTRRIFDLGLALPILVLLGIPMIAIGILIRLDSPGPALFRQRRCGRFAEEFVMYKFRTMQVGAASDDARHREMIRRELAGEDTSSNGSWKLDADPRVTPIGHWLRRTSLDELPQLLNVVHGEMSLVGPRPCLPWEATLFPMEYVERFAVPPGLVGLWQVSGRSTMGTLDMLRLDVTYVRTRKFSRDVTILLLAIPAILRGDGAQ